MELSIKHRNETYEKIKEKLSESRRVVYESIADLGQTDLDTICFNLNRTKNELSGRITELKFYGLIKEVGDNISSRSNNKVTLYTLTTPEEQIEIVNKTFVELREKSDSLVNDYNLGLSKFSINLIKREIRKINAKIKQLEKFA